MSSWDGTERRKDYIKLNDDISNVKTDVAVLTNTVNIFLEGTKAHRIATCEKLNLIINKMGEWGERCANRAATYEHFKKHLSDHEEEVKVGKRLIKEKAFQYIVGVSIATFSFFLGIVARYFMKWLT